MVTEKKTQSTSFHTPETLNLLYLEQNLIFLSVKNLIIFWILPDAKLRTKTNFYLVIVEGSKLGMKSDYNCREKSKEKIEYIVSSVAMV